MNNKSLNHYNQDEINLRQIFKSLKERSRFIFGFTGIVTLITIGYVLSLTAPPTQYKVETSFLKPNAISVIKLNQNFLAQDPNSPLTMDGTNSTANTADSVFSKLLTTLNSPVLQRDVFDDGGYAEKLGQEGVPSLSISKDVNSIGLKLPHILSTHSSNPVIVSEFLNEVLTAADNKTVNYFINVQKLKILNRLNEITTERQLLLTKSKQDRFSQIQRIKEADSQKLIEIKNKINAARLIAKTERMNQIVVLTNAAQLASSLGIIENNLNQFVKSPNDKSFNITLQNGANIPEWYLYGETVLLEMVALLKNRESDDPYIPELVLFENQIKRINNNTLLQTLEERLDDRPFNAEINQLDMEIIQLESISPDSTGINAMQLYQAATSEIIPTKNKNQLIIVLALIGSFMLSLVLVFLMNAFKEEDVTSIQKGK